MAPCNLVSAHYQAKPPIECCYFLRLAACGIPHNYPQVCLRPSRQITCEDLVQLCLHRNLPTGNMDGSPARRPGQKMVHGHLASNRVFDTYLEGKVSSCLSSKARVLRTMSLRTFAAPAHFEMSALKAGKTRLLYPGAPLPAGVNVAIVPAGHTLEKFDHLPSYGAVNREREETAPPSDMIGCTRLINSFHHRPRACRRYQRASRFRIADPPGAGAQLENKAHAFAGEGNAFSNITSTHP